MSLIPLRHAPRTRPVRGVEILLTLLVLLAGIASPARAQILNTLSPFPEDGKRWTAGAETSFSVTGGNSEVLSLSGAGHLQYQGARERLRLITSGEWERANGEDNTQKSVVHLRHNHRFTPWLASLAFAQHQRNPFQRLSSRFLVGAGARFELLRRPRHHLALGLSHMVEIERIEGIEGSETDQRLSSFLTGNLGLTANASLEGTAFVQPLWKDFTDLRALALAALRVDLSSRMFVKISGEYTYDSDPPDRVENSDWKLRTGIGFSL